MGAGSASQPERNLKLLLEYDGTGLAGWQRQAGAPTVQGHLEAALDRLTGQPVKVIGAGRTDAGVHARGQVANFRTATGLNPAELQRGANALLPPQIAVLSVQEAAWDFHARYDAWSKVYEYNLFLGPVRSPLRRLYAWQLAPPLDLPAMARALKVVEGQHDFASFQSAGSGVQTTTRRVLQAHLEEEGDAVRITLEADGFLRHMVRALVGTLVQVGRGRVSLAEFEEILRARDRSRAGATAPAHGLCLREVRYQEP